MKHLLTTKLLALALVPSVAADVIYSNLQNIAIPATYDGLYLNVETGAWTTPGNLAAGVAGWDINPFSGGRSVANSPGFQPVRSGTQSSSPILNLAAGDSVGSGSVFSTFVQGAGGETPGGPGYGGSAMLTGSGGNFTAGTEGYLGFRLNGSNYGSMRMVFTNNTSGAMIKDWAYDTSGAPVVVGAIKQVGRDIILSSGFTLASALNNSGGATHLVKNGNGTNTLTAANTYTGNTTINGGTLVFTQPTIASNSTVTIASGAVLNLNFTGINQVRALILNGVSQPNGVYDASTPGGYLAGTGRLRVGFTETVDFNSGALTDSFSVNMQMLPIIGVSNYSLASNGLGGTQGVDLVTGTTSDATLVYTPRGYNLSILGSLDVSCYFRKQASTAGSPALSLGLTGSSAGRLASYDVANTLDDSHVALQLGRNSTSLRFEIQAKAGNTTTINTANTSSNLALTNGNWYQFRASFARLSATVIQVSGAVYNSNASGAIGTLVQNYPAVSVTLSDIAGDNQLWVALRGFGDAGADAWDNFQIVAQALPATAPNPPTDFTATAASPFKVDLSWADASNNEKGFVIGRSNNPGGPYSDIATTAAGVTSFSDTTADGDSTYYYTVRASLPGNDSPLSTQATAITPLPALATYYVSPSGSNTAPPAGGTLTAPFRTISYAASQAKPGDTFRIRAGTYRETVTPPSGTLKYPITFASYPNEPVVISGADPLNLTWTVHSGSIYKATTALNFRQIFVDGVMMNEARWPNAQVDKILDAPRSVVGSTPTGVVNLAITDPNLPAGNLTGATIHITPGNLNGEWSAYTRKTNAYNAATKTLSWSTTWNAGDTNTYLAKAGNPYWIYGVLPLLDIATEWHLDTTAGTVYLWTPDGASPASHNVEVKSRAHAFMMDNRSYVTVKNLNIFAAGISMKATTGCVVDNCHLRYIQHDTTASWDVGGIDSACSVSGTGNVWKNSSILFSSQNGIQLDGVGNTVENCVIRDACYYPGQYYSSVKSSSGSSQTITRNTFSRSGRALILPYAPAMEISYNDISHGQMLTKDGGALYVWGFDGQGTAIHHNWVHHDQSGIYIDNNTSNYLIHRNVCYDNRYGLHFNQAGRNHKVYHNTLLRSSDKSIPNTSSGTAVPTLAGTTIINTLHDGVFGNLNDATLINNGWHPPVGPDFIPQPGSGAIDTGTTISGYTEGFVGAGPDIGAYEAGGTYWVPGADFTIPAFPTPDCTGSLTASPSTISLEPGQLGSTSISWTTTRCAAAQVTVTGSSGVEELFADATSFTGAVAPWIGPGSTTFRLYGDRTRSHLLDTVEVIGTQAPLTVQSDGTLRLDNRPFTGFGVNYFDAFNRVLWNVADTSYEAGFQALGQWGVPFARLDVSGYWPVHQNLFFTNRAEYFRRLDGVVASAERHGVGLIPSLFWTTFTFSDLAGEPLDQYAVTDSLTRQKMREFTTEIVNRYKNSRAIWAWEFGNEWNLAVDLPNAVDFLPPTWTHLGNPATRDPVRDILTTGIILPAMQEFANLVKSLDPGRPISSGHAIPRTSAWHLDQWQRGLLPPDQAWTTDSYAQAKQIAIRHCPAPFDLLSIHPYHISEDIPRVANYAQIAAESGIALFVGEFGAFTESDYNQLLAACRVAPLVAMWAYDRIGEATHDGMNATTTNSRSYMLRALQPSTFSAWSRSWGPLDTPGGNGQTAFGQYAFGAPAPGASAVHGKPAMAGNDLTLEAIVRTNDPSLTLFGETSTSLAPGSWTTNGVSVTISPDQTGVLPGCQRRFFSVPVAPEETKKFLRLRAVSP